MQLMRLTAVDASNPDGGFPIAVNPDHVKTVACHEGRTVLALRDVGSVITVEESFEAVCAAFSHATASSTMVSEIIDVNATR